MGGFGLGYGLGALNSAGNEIRDYRQESEIQQSRAELEQAKAREAELEARLKKLEEAQAADTSK
jgi:cell division protein FtsB